MIRSNSRSSAESDDSLVWEEEEEEEEEEGGARFVLESAVPARMEDLTRSLSDLRCCRR